VAFEPRIFFHFEFPIFLELLQSEFKSPVSVLWETDNPTNG